ncbi:uncharacterized protein LOC119899974 [Micropterus salmoides]|uniref:uncharacterized protein LOC119899973 n=1 Tax=Micropterus salmoides TaxID=27706 RepID=UPI0018EA5DE3|nr:uncharacterized protein LOC119899973 [Micropterus salmoides]XP_038570734.1 uncharacterized protein LOC119899974 [Micropterus salmoides]
MTEAELLNTLKDLESEEFKDFKWYLQKDDSLEGRTAISKGKLEKAEQRDTVDLMVQTYTLTEAVEVTKILLMKIKRNDLVQRLSPSSSAPKAKSRKKVNKSQGPKRGLDTDSPVTVEGGTSLALEPTSSPSDVRERDLSNSNLGDPGVKMLPAALVDPRCGPDPLRVERGEGMRSGLSKFSSDEVSLESSSVNMSSNSSVRKRKMASMNQSYGETGTFGFFSKLWRR